SSGNYIYSEGSNPRTVSSAEAAQLWGDYMREVVKDREVTYFSKPQDIVTASIDPFTGKLPNKFSPTVVQENYKTENIPKKVESLHGPTETVKIDKKTGLLATENCPTENVVEYTFIENSGIRLGPTEINFREINKDNKDPDDLTKGIYMVNKGEPVQKIDPEYGVPKQNSDGDYLYQLKPNSYCQEHPVNKSKSTEQTDVKVEEKNEEEKKEESSKDIIFDIWEFLKSGD
ncbi:MAG: penicillin-binding protein, partial [Halanaerobiales bacterium]|nr:penicillin-binding protein [Halanaerobiales bacterium]